MSGEEAEPPPIPDETLELTVEIVAAYVSHNAVEQEALPNLIRSVHGVLAGLSVGGMEAAAERPKPAVPINKSVQNDYIICLEDGKKLKMLKRYLRSNHGMSPEEYRKKWGLPQDYPMVAPAYAQTRSDFAKRIGLGRGVRRRGDGLPDGEG